MEFGCRYIYVDQPLPQCTEKDTSLLDATSTPEPPSGDLMYDLAEPEPIEYSNFQLEDNLYGRPAVTVTDSDGDNSQRACHQTALPVTETFNDSLPQCVSNRVNTYDDIPTPPQTVQKNETPPPPIPPRTKKPSLVPGIVIPFPDIPVPDAASPSENLYGNCILEEDSQPYYDGLGNTYNGVPSSTSTEIKSDRPPPPPIPSRILKPPSFLVSDITVPSSNQLCSEPQQFQPDNTSHVEPTYMDILPASYEEVKKKATTGIQPINMNLAGPPLPPRPDLKNSSGPPPSPRSVPKNSTGPPPSPRPELKNPKGPPRSPRPVCKNPASPAPRHSIACLTPTVPPTSVFPAQNTTAASTLAPGGMPQLPANCNILLLNVGKIIDTSDTTLNLETPSVCRSCSACLSSLNQVHGNKTWTCVFCGTENSIRENEQCADLEGDQLFLCTNLLGCEPLESEDDLLIFCIDISGSMSVTLEVLYDNKPESNSHNVYTSRMEVKLYGDGTSQPQVLEDCELLDTDYLKSQGENQPTPNRIAQTLDALQSKIECLTETGATALGPAALVCIAMASRRPGSKVIICTDGRANTDLGNLEDIAEEYVYESSRLYYSTLSEMALQHSVVVSVVTIEGTDCRLRELGQLADKTGGKVNIVHPLQLADEFQSIVEERINATDVKVKVYLPNSMYLLHEAHTISIMERMIGSTTSDSILSIEFNVKTSKIQEVLRHSQLPVQVELTFCLPDGRRGHRVLSQKRPLTNDSSAALDSINLNVIQIHSAQISAQLAIEGRVDEASKIALALKELIARVMQHENYQAQGEEYEDWENCMSPIYEDLQVYVKKDAKKNNEGTHTDTPVLKAFSDEMANMMFQLKKAKKKVLQKLQM
uniref:VWFA domain-containing protein n=1 Tax=Leptobrachium leishanense TaxID=445787 RepID=A0A8C5R2E1_9ANUR